MEHNFGNMNISNTRYISNFILLCIIFTSVYYKTLNLTINCRVGDIHEEPTRRGLPMVHN